MQQDTDGSWDCDYCHKKKLVETRNCGGKYKPFTIRIFDAILTQCPVSTLNNEWMDVIGIVNMSEGGGMGGGFTSPSRLLEEANVFFSYRNIVLGEKNRIERFKDKNKGK